jgi:hypothetical protein
MMQRRRLKASRNIGFSATVSARALKVDRRFFGPVLLLQAPHHQQAPGGKPCPRILAADRRRIALQTRRSGRGAIRLRQLLRDLGIQGRRDAAQGNQTTGIARHLRGPGRIQIRPGRRRWSIIIVGILGHEGRIVAAAHVLPEQVAVVAPGPDRARLGGKPEAALRQRRHDAIEAAQAGDGHHPRAAEMAHRIGSKGLLGREVLQLRRGSDPGRIGPPQRRLQLHEPAHLLRAHHGADEAERRFPQMAVLLPQEARHPIRPEGSVWLRQHPQRQMGKAVARGSSPAGAPSPRSTVAAQAALERIEGRPLPFALAAGDGGVRIRQEPPGLGGGKRSVHGCGAGRRPAAIARIFISCTPIPAPFSRTQSPRVFGPREGAGNGARLNVALWPELGSRRLGRPVVTASCRSHRATTAGRGASTALVHVIDQR